MKQQVLQFFTNLLAKVKTPLLPHVNVHKPIQVSKLKNSYLAIYMYCIFLIYTFSIIVLKIQQTRLTLVGV